MLTYVAIEYCIRRDMNLQKTLKFLQPFCRLCCRTSSKKRIIALQDVVITYTNVEESGVDVRKRNVVEY